MLSGTIHPTRGASPSNVITGSSFGRANVTEPKRSVPIVSLWPRLGLSAFHESRDGGNRGHQNGTVSLSIFAPIEISPLSHILVGLGPLVMADVVRRADGVARPFRTSLSLNAEVAAWF